MHCHRFASAIWSSLSSWNVSASPVETRRAGLSGKAIVAAELTVYSHVTPGMDRSAAYEVAELLLAPPPTTDPSRRAFRNVFPTARKTPPETGLQGRFAL